MTPDIAELRETVARMESPLRGEALFAVYQRLAERFESDLGDERDAEQPGDG